MYKSKSGQSDEAHAMRLITYWNKKIGGEKNKKKPQDSYSIRVTIWWKCDNEDAKNTNNGDIV